MKTINLVGISGISTRGIFSIVDIGNPKNILAWDFPHGDKGVLLDGHGQHRVALVVDVLSNQVHSPR